MAQFIQTQYKEFVNINNVLNFGLSYNEQYKVWYVVAYYPDPIPEIIPISLLQLVPSNLKKKRRKPFEK